MVWQEDLKPSVARLCSVMDLLYNLAYADNIKETIFIHLDRMQEELKKKGYVWNYDTQTARRVKNGSQ